MTQANIPAAAFQGPKLPDFGHDLSCLLDLDANQSEVSSITCLIQALIRRLQTPIGTLIGDPNYGFDLIGEIDDDLSPGDTARIAQQIDFEFVKDERVQASTTQASFASGVLVTSTTILTAVGPFQFVLGISSIISVLSPTGITIASLPVTPTVPANEQVISFAIGTKPVYTSATSIPAGAIVLAAYLDLASAGTVVYSAGTTIQLGQSGNPSLIMNTAQNIPTVVGVYEVDQATQWGTSPKQVTVTIGGTPAAGSANVVVLYAVPSS